MWFVVAKLCLPGTVGRGHSVQLTAVVCQSVHSSCVAHSAPVIQIDRQAFIWWHISHPLPLFDVPSADLSRLSVAPKAGNLSPSCSSLETSTWYLPASVWQLCLLCLWVTCSLSTGVGGGELKAITRESGFLNLGHHDKLISLHSSL